LFEDESLRVEGTPGIAPETWAWLLRENGFDPVRFPAQALHALGQQVIVAQSDGVIWPTVHGADVAEPAARIEVAAASPVTAPRGAAGTLRERLADSLAELVAGVLKIPAGRIDYRRPLERYGVDSIIALQLATALSGVLGISDHRCDSRSSARDSRRGSSGMGRC
jgi:hypothetical protein